MNYNVHKITNDGCVWCGKGRKLERQVLKNPNLVREIGESDRAFAERTRAAEITFVEQQKKSDAMFKARLEENVLGEECPATPQEAVLRLRSLEAIRKVIAFVKDAPSPAVSLSDSVKEFKQNLLASIDAQAKKSVESLQKIEAFAESIGAPVEALQDMASDRIQVQHRTNAIAAATQRLDQLIADAVGVDEPSVVLEQLEGRANAICDHLKKFYGITA